MAIDQPTSGGIDLLQPTTRGPLLRGEALPALAGLTAILAGGFILVGWNRSLPAFGGQTDGLQPMDPATASCLVVAGAALLLQLDPGRNRWRPFLGRALGACVAFAGFAHLVGMVAGWDPRLHSFSVRDAVGGAGLEADPMAPLAATSLLFVGSALLTFRDSGRARWPVSHVFALVPLALGGLTVLGHAYRVGLLRGVALDFSMPLDAGLSLMGLAAAVLHGEPQRGPGPVLAGGDIGALTVRRLLPPVVMTIGILGFLELLGQSAGLFGPHLGVSLFVTASVIVLTLVIWFNAESLQRGEAARSAAATALRYGHEELRESQAVLSQRLAARSDDLARTGEALRQEVTVRRDAQGQVSKLSRAVEQTGDLVLITDRDGRIEYVNPAFEAHTGYAQAEILGRTPRILKSEVHEPALYQALWNAVSQGHEFRGTLWNRKRNGELYQEEKTITPIRQEDGAITHFVSTGRDVTERTQLEEQLRQSQKMEAIGRLAGGVAHDFNNMLTVIMGYAQMMRPRLGHDDRTRLHLEEIFRAAERSASLTRQLLAFSRQQVLEPRVLDLDHVITDLDKMLRRLIGEDIDFVTMGAPGLGRVKADPGQIEQVIVNLVVNARDAMPSGGRLTIETAGVDLDPTFAHPRGLRAGRYVMLAVTDTGPGMAPEIQARIFEPFFTTKGIGKGTGLGLATVMSIARQSDGHVEVHSEPGHGASFKVFLPRVEEPLEHVRAVAEASLERIEGDEIVLLVEDEPTVRQVIGDALRGLGYSVIESSDGREALALCTHGDRPIDLVVSDIVLPVVGGTELAERLAVRFPELPVLFVSGYTDRALIHQGLRRHGTAFLQKPFTPEALSRRVREMLDQSSRRAA